MLKKSGLRRSRAPGTAVAASDPLNRLGGGSLTGLPIIEAEGQNLCAYIPTHSDLHAGTFHRLRQSGIDEELLGRTPNILLFSCCRNPCSACRTDSSPYLFSELSNIGR